jgi:hypothetical protein
MMITVTHFDISTILLKNGKCWINSIGNLYTGNTNTIKQH